MAVSSLKVLAGHSRYVAAMALAGVGDSLGYKCGKWELEKSGQTIHKDVTALGGLSSLSCKCMHLILGILTVMLPPGDPGTLHRLRLNHIIAPTQHT